MQDKLITDLPKEDSFVRSRQETGSFCGPCVMQMLLSQFGILADQKEIVIACGAAETVMKAGIPPKQLILGIKKLYPEVAVWQKSNSNLEDIEKLISGGYLVAFDWQGIFAGDEYGDDVLPGFWEKVATRIKKEPVLLGDQGHYCIALEVNGGKGYLRFADPYGHYAGKDRFVALWEFEERWWDDRLDKDETGKIVRVIEERLIFVLTKMGDHFPASLGMEEV